MDDWLLHLGGPGAREGIASRRNDALNAEADSRLKDALAKIESPEN